MKTLKLMLLLTLSPFYVFAQQQLSGLWMGSLSNDSNTVRKDQSFEIILAEYRGKVSGYSRTTFFVNDTLYYIIKRVKGTITGDVCEVKDDDVVSHNFPQRPEKKVKVISTFRRNQSDSTWYLEGDWRTTKTKKFYTISGKVDLKEEKDYTQSKLFDHLEELQIAKEFPFFQESKKSTEVLAKTEKPVPVIPVSTKPAAKDVATTTKTAQPGIVNATRPNNNPVAANTQPVLKNTQPVVEPGSAGIHATETKVVGTNPKTTETPVIASTNPVNKPVTTNTNPVQPITSAPTVSTIPIETVAKTTPKEVLPSSSVAIEKNNPAKEVARPAVASGNPAAIAKTTSQPVNTQKDPVIAATTKTPVPATKIESPATIKPTTSGNPEVAVAPPQEAKTNASIVSGNTPAMNQPIQETKKQIIPTGIAAMMLRERKTDAFQTVSFVSDSLVLALYDNGEIDGDTVSVLLNGELLMEKQGLKASAIRKTIYIAPGEDELTLVLYAENLGKYPPNTGLLMVYDGEERYQIRFSADLNKNAAVVFRRKK